MFVFMTIHRNFLEIMIDGIAIIRMRICPAWAKLHTLKKMEQLQTDFLISPDRLFIFCIACFEPIVLKFIALGLQALTRGNTTNYSSSCK